MVKRIHRRTVLRGLGGTAVALPALEIMGRPDTWGGPKRAYAQPGSRPRFLMAYGGMSTGADRIGDDFMTPSSEGFGYEIREQTQAIETLGVREDISLVTGLKIPWRTGSSVPPGGREAETVHYRVLPCTACGTHTSSESGGTRPRGPSADQIAADVIAGDRPHRVLVLGVQQGAGCHLSYRDDGDSIREVDAINDPRVAYDSLFTGFAPGDQAPDPAAEAQARFLLRRRRSVLDLVSDSTARLLPRLGGEDRRRLDLHMTQIRDLETRLDRLGMSGGSGGGGTCTVPEEPGGSLDQRAVGEVFARIIASAFACDLTNVVALPITEPKCYMEMSDISDHSGDVHSGSHGGGSRVERLQVAIGWFVEIFARITRLLKDTPDGDGTSVLDHSALTLFFEAGWGFDPATDTPIAAHSTENLIVLIGGRAGGLRSGQHVRGNERHPASVILSALNAVGVETDRLGEVVGDVPELFG